MIGDGDVELIFESGDFNEAAVFETQGGDTTLQVIFNEPSAVTDVYSEQIVAVKPSLWVRTDELTNKFVKGLAVTVRGREFTCERFEKSGVGFTTVHLQTA